MIYFNKKGGFTLIEIMIALVLAAILILAFSSAIVNGIRSEARIDKRLEAIRISNSIAEKLRDIRENEDNKWVNIQGTFEGYQVNFQEASETIDNNNDDIFIKYKTLNNGIHFFEIIWESRNYNIELLLAGE